MNNQQPKEKPGETNRGLFQTREINPHNVMLGPDGRLAEREPAASFESRNGGKGVTP